MALNSRVQVDLPAEGIIVTHSGKYPYVFHVTETYRDMNGRPTNKKRSIGKLDNTTGKLIPNNAYYEFYGDLQDKTPVEATGDIREAGVPFLVNWVFTSLGINNMLAEAFGKNKADTLQTIASYLLVEGNVMSYLDDFCERSLCKNFISDKSASLLFANISSSERINFFRQWVTSRSKDEYIAYDVTSFSSYAEGIADTEWGYNRDGERLPQINMGLYIGQTSRLPVFYVTYPGSIVDKSHLPSMMAYNANLGITDVRFVMDKGFVATANIEYMREAGYFFIVAAENRFKAIRSAIDGHKNEVRASRNRIDRFNLFGIAVKGRFYGIASTLHIYYDYDRAAAQTADMYRKIASEGEVLAQISEATEAQLKKYKKHYTITRGEKGGLAFELNHAAIDSLVADLGYFCILSNDSLSSEEVLAIYRNKDTIEKAFCELKNHIDMKRLRTHNRNTTEGKMFCAFLALILRKHIENKLSEWLKKNNYTVERVLRELNKVRSIFFSGKRRLLNPLTKKQKEIYSLLGAQPEDLTLFIESFLLK
jgi:transposase